MSKGLCNIECYRCNKKNKRNCKHRLQAFGLVSQNRVYGTTPKPEKDVYGDTLEESYKKFGMIRGVIRNAISKTSKRQRKGT